MLFIFIHVHSGKIGGRCPIWWNTVPLGGSDQIDELWCRETHKLKLITWTSVRCISFKRKLTGVLDILQLKWSRCSHVLLKCWKCYLNIFSGGRMFWRNLFGKPSPKITQVFPFHPTNQHLHQYPKSTPKFWKKTLPFNHRSRNPLEPGAFPGGGHCWCAWLVVATGHFVAGGWLQTLDWVGSSRFFGCRDFSCV